MARGATAGHHWLVMPRKFTSIAAAVVASLLAAAVVWVAVDVRRTWRRLDSAADSFVIPNGFTEVARGPSGNGILFRDVRERR